MTTKPKFTFKQSVLSNKADEIWEQRKNDAPKTDDDKEHKLDLGISSTTMPSFTSKKEHPTTKGENGFKTTIPFGATESQSSGESSKTVETASDILKTVAKKANGAMDPDKPIKLAFATGDNKDFQSANGCSGFGKGVEMSSDAVNVFTGEEGETNISQTACKFYVFDREKKTWAERGLGTLRINEKETSDGVVRRIVGRTQGNQKVLINSRITSSMHLDKLANTKLKIFAQSPDFDTPQCFLITASDVAMANLVSTLESFIDKESSRKRKLSDKEKEADGEEGPKKSTN